MSLITNKLFRICILLPPTLIGAFMLAIVYVQSTHNWKFMIDYRQNIIETFPIIIIWLLISGFIFMLYDIKIKKVYGR